MISFSPVSEHFFQIHRRLSQHFVPYVRVDVRGCLVVRVAHDLHGDQRVDAGLVQEGNEIVTQEMRHQRGLDLFQNVPVLLFVGS